ncbi:phosphate ABC transporter substrate-binding protein, partial [Haloarcula hispanica]
MAHDPDGLSEFVSRRKFIATTGATSIAAIAGCSSGSGDSESDGGAGESADTEAVSTEM